MPPKKRIKVGVGKGVRRAKRNALIRTRAIRDGIVLDSKYDTQNESIETADTSHGSIAIVSSTTAVGKNPVELVMEIKMEPATTPSGGEIGSTDDWVVKTEQLDVCDDKCKPEFVDWKIKTEELDISDYEHAGSDADDSRRVEDHSNGAEDGKQSATESPPLTAKSFDCDLCLATFRTMASLKEHVTGFCFKNLLVRNCKKVVLSTETFNCSCKVKFNNLKELKLHVKNSPKTGCQIVRCKFCSKVFNNVRSRNEHLLTHTGKKKYECKFCSKRFSQSSSRNRHLLTHTGEKKYECKVCQKRFSLSSNRNRHFLIHTGELKHECKICPKRFSRASHRNRHELSHTGEKKYECKYCQKLFSQTSSRNVHLRTHKEHVISLAGAEPVNIAELDPLTAKSFDCDLCLAKFPTKKSLTEHVTGFCFKNLLVRNCKKVVLSTETFNCSCKVKFNNLKELKLHVKNSPKTGCQIVRCKFCSKVFNDVSSRNQHLLTHTGNKKYECEFCPKRFKKGSNRNQHLPTHTGEKKYECKFCQKRFSHSSNRNAHLLTHKREKKYQCKLCQKQFNTNGNLNQHLLTHTGE